MCHTDPDDFIDDEEGQPISRGKKKRTVVHSDKALQEAQDVFGVDFDFADVEDYGSEYDEEEDEEVQIVITLFVSTMHLIGQIDGLCVSVDRMSMKMRKGAVKARPVRSVVDTARRLYSRCLSPASWKGVT